MVTYPLALGTSRLTYQPKSAELQADLTACRDGDRWEQ
uniref:MucR family transcriptional regulator n=1 Tax=Rhizobium meliloti TaxID=382 RepID=I2E193_RHIML|nr:MucR family transcriptional regulator [Sinorhizobium meliloti]